MNVQLVMSFGSIINIKPLTGSPNPVVKSSRLVYDKIKKLAVETNIVNKGNHNFLLVQADTTVSVFGANKKTLWSHRYTPNQTMQNFGLGLVQPGKTRKMQIPLPNIPDHIARQAKSVKLEVRPSAK
jgi:hypothetical protein